MTWEINLNCEFLFPLVRLTLLDLTEYCMLLKLHACVSAPSSVSCLWSVCVSQESCRSQTCKVSLFWLYFANRKTKVIGLMSKTFADVIKSFTLCSFSFFDLVSNWKHVMVNSFSLTSISEQVSYVVHGYTKDESDCISASHSFLLVTFSFQTIFEKI